MLTLAWSLLVLAPVIAVFYLVWAYRKRTAARATASKERYAQIFDSAPMGPAASVVLTPAGGAGTTGSATAAAPAIRTPNVYRRRAQLLTSQQSQLREVLVSGLPGYEVFAQVSLASLLEVVALPEGREREQRARALAQHTVDCAVCTQTLAVVAVVDLDGGSSAEARFKVEALKAAGIRYLRWNSLELPRSSEVVTLIAGE